MLTMYLFCLSDLPNGNGKWKANDDDGPERPNENVKRKANDDDGPERPNENGKRKANDDDGPERPNENGKRKANDDDGPERPNETVKRKANDNDGPERPNEKRILVITEVEPGKFIFVSFKYHWHFLKEFGWSNSLEQHSSVGFVATQRVALKSWPYKFNISFHLI